MLQSQSEKPHDELKMFTLGSQRFAVLVLVSEGTRIQFRLETGLYELPISNENFSSCANL